jgi:hypothetical protein
VKKTVPITLIALLLFNVLGYHALFYGLRYQHERQLAHQIDNKGYEGQTITLRIPLNLPYAYDHSSFQRTSGKFEYNGNAYQLLEQKLSQDTLYLICLHDEGSTHIKKSFSDFVKSFADQPGNSNQKTQTVLKLMKEYVGSTCSLNHLSTGWISFFMFNKKGEFLISSYSASIVHPPERA